MVFKWFAEEVKFCWFEIKFVCDQATIEFDVMEEGYIVNLIFVFEAGLVAEYSV